MTNTYDTSGEPLGSTAVKVLYNNASNLDDAVNSTENTWVDRPPFGRVRRTWRGMENAFDSFLTGTAFELPPLVYADGSPLQVDRATQLIERGGFLYGVKLPSSFPVTLTGTWATDEPQLTVRNDQSLRQEINSGVVRFESVAALKAGRFDGDIGELTSYRTSAPGVGGGSIRWDAASVETADAGSIFQVPGVVTGRWKRPINRGVWAEDFGVYNDGTNAASNSVALWAAIRSMRSNPTSMIQYIGGPTVTGYTSGTLNFGLGVFALLADTFEVTQDMGLTLKGQGGRGMNQALPAPTTLLQKGVSSGYFWRHMGNAARALRFEKIDICYENGDFTGDVIDSYASPDLYVGPGCRVGCFGGFSDTRVQSAARAVRLTYDERATFDHCVIDGAVDGIHSDTTRTLGGSNFGGWGLNMIGVTFYDFTGRHFYHPPNRSRYSTTFAHCNFNPINTSPQRCIDAENLSGYDLNTPIFTPSTTAQPIVEYFKILGSTGSIANGTYLGAASKVGTVGGVNPASTKWENNEVSTLGGLTVTGGVVRGGGNEYSNCDNGVDVAPVGITTLDIGPDIFKAGVTGNSYRISADSALLGGKINYIAEQDNSNSRVSNASTRISIENMDHRISTLAVSGSTLSLYFSGRTYNMTVAGTAILPTPMPGIKLRVVKTGATALTVATTAGSNFVVGATGTRTSAVATAAELGACIEFEALSTTSWLGRVVSGTWTFT